MNDRLAAFSVGPRASLRETMHAIDRGSVELALVVDGRGVLLGTVTDGDIRRALLGGATLDDAVEPYANAGFLATTAEAGRAEVLDLMQSRLISQIPVLDAEGRVVALHLLRELVGGEERPNAAVIMAGGRGRRLQPLTEEIPKPMLPVAGRPILERIVLHLVGSGIRRIYVAVNYMKEIIKEHFGDGARFGCVLSYLEEGPGEPLGTAGALRLLPADVLGGPTPLLVMNGDLVTDADVEPLLRAHEARSARLTVGVRSHTHEVPFGVVRVREGMVVGVEEKPMAVWDINAGMYVLDPSLIERIPSGRAYDMPDLIADCVREGAAVAAHRLDGEWVDVGRVDELRRARGELP